MNIVKNEELSKLHLFSFMKGTCVRAWFGSLEPTKQLDITRLVLQSAKGENRLESVLMSKPYAQMVLVDILDK
jgi:hypothetical protein